MAKFERMTQTGKTQKFFHKNCGGEIKMIMFGAKGKKKMMAVCQKCGAMARRINDLK